MVNTFITILPDNEGYLKSAKTLDDLRLRKQCVEAYQIRNSIVDLFTVSNYLSIKFPAINLPDLSPIDKWVSEIRGEYKKLGFKYIIQDNKIRKLSDNGEMFSINKSDYILGKTYFIQNDKVKIMMKPIHYKKYFDPNYSSKARVEKILDRNSLIISDLGDRIIKLGWISHPAVRQWIGYDDALKLYINDHLDAYTERFGKSMCIPKYSVDKSKVIHPWWLGDFYIMSHRCALMRKEKARNEKPHYVNFEFFKIDDKYKKLGYLWPSKLSLDLANKLVKNDFDVKLFSDITNDDIDI